MLGLGVGGVDLQHAAVPGVDFPLGVHCPGDGIVLRLPETGVLHHVLGRLVDLGGIILVGGEDPHLGPLLPVPQQVVQPQPGGQFGLAVLLGQLVVEEPPVSPPAAVLVLLLHTVEIPDGVQLPVQQPEGLTSPLVGAEAQ